MRRTLTLVFVLAAFLLIFSTGAWGLVCGDTSGALPQGAVPLFRIDSTHNAHAQTTAFSNYSRVVYCTPAAGETIVAGSGTELLRLSTPDNAHAELVSGTNNYPISIKLGTPTTGHSILSTIVNASTGNSCPPNYSELIRLARASNSHLQSKNYSGPQATYDYRVCVAYDNGSGGGPQPDNHIILTGITGTPANVAMNNSFNANIETTNQVAGDNDYTNIASATITVMCRSGAICDSLAASNDYDTIMSALSNMAAGNPGVLLPSTLQITQFGNTSAAQNTFVGIMNGLYTANLQSPGFLESAGNPTHSRIYNVNPTTMGLTPGNYVILSLSWRGNFDFPAVGSSNRDEGDYATTNVKAVSFNIKSSCGDGYIDPTSVPLPEQCDIATIPPNIGCQPTFACDNSCQCVPGGSGTTGTAGDVFVLKKIVFPNVYTNSDIVAELTIENKNLTLAQDTYVTAIVRDSKGVQQFQLQTTDPGSHVVFNGNGTIVHTITIQKPSAPYLNEGETYTLYATVQKYIDTVAGPPDLSELVTANNSGYKTFTTLEPPQAFSIPDSPWWMSALMVTIVLGWLFVSSRKNEE